jgi:hypothetical protein
MSVLTLYPYFRSGCWVFDDPRTGLKEEAFVLGADAVLTRLVHQKAIPAAERGFTLRFSDEPFDGFDAELVWVRSDDPLAVPGRGESAAAGNWYSGAIVGEVMEGWLCPALGLYFDAAPARIFVKVEPLPAGVDPKWRVRNRVPAPRQAAARPEEGISGE